jgi:hypothetical protein
LESIVELRTTLDVSDTGTMSHVGELVVKDILTYCTDLHLP